MILFGEIAHEEVADIEEEGDDQRRDESLPEEQHQQREHEGGHFDDGLVVSCDDESGSFSVVFVHLMVKGYRRNMKKS